MQNFGNALTKDILLDLIKARQNLDPHLLHPVTVKVQGLARVVLFELEDLLGKYAELNLANISAFPDQKNYPEKFLPNKRAYYPKQIGLARVIESLKKELDSIGVEVITNAFVKKIEIENSKISKVYISKEGYKLNYVEALNMIWTVPLYPLYPLFKSFFNIKENLIFEKPQITAIVNLVINKEPNSKGLYYFYCHEDKYIHRISFPDNYSKAEKNYGFKISIECIISSPQETDFLIDHVCLILLKSNFISSIDNVIFSKVEILKGGYPNFSLSNLEAHSKIRESINSLGISNLHNVGTLSKDDMFFQFQILENCYEIISQI